MMPVLNWWNLLSLGLFFNSTGKWAFLMQAKMHVCGAFSATLQMTKQGSPKKNRGLSARCLVWLVHCRQLRQSKSYWASENRQLAECSCLMVWTWPFRKSRSKKIRPVRFAGMGGVTQMILRQIIKGKVFWQLLHILMMRPLEWGEPLHIMQEWRACEPDLCNQREVGEVDDNTWRIQVHRRKLREHELCCGPMRLEYRKYISSCTVIRNANSIHNQHRTLSWMQMKRSTKRIANWSDKFSPGNLTFDPLVGICILIIIAVHRATVEAFHMAATQTLHWWSTSYKPLKTLLHIIAEKILWHYGQGHAPFLRSTPTRFGKNKDINLTAILSQHFPVHAGLIIVLLLPSVTRLQQPCQPGGDRRSGYFPQNGWWDGFVPMSCICVRYLKKGMHPWAWSFWWV